MQHPRLRMRIGLDCRLFSESGVGRYTRNLVKHLQILDHNNFYTLFVLSKDYKDIKFQISNFKFQIIKSDIRWHTLEEQLKFPSIINKENLDLMHFPYFSVPIFYNKPYVVTIHDLILHHFPTGLASTLPRWLYKLKLIGYKFVISKIAKKAKKIITVSQATNKEIVDHLGVDSDKVIVTYEGIDQKLADARPPASSLAGEVGRGSRKLVAKGKYFLYVGNAYPHKNLERLLEPFSLLCHPDPDLSGEGSHEILRSAQNDIKLVFVGKEDYFYKRLKGKVKNMNLEKSVKFLGEVSDEELTSLYRNALALVVPSLMEGFGLPALEAMANKCLVLASDIPALREVCGDAAIYFAPYNPKDIAEKMREACFNDLNHFSDKIEKGLERVKLFSWEKMARETLRVYESCVGR